MSAKMWRVTHKLYELIQRTIFFYYRNLTSLFTVLHFCLGAVYMEKVVPGTRVTLLLEPTIPSVYMEKSCPLNPGQQPRMGTIECNAHAQEV